MLEYTAISTACPDCGYPTEGAHYSHCQQLASRTRTEAHDADQPSTPTHCAYCGDPFPAKPGKRFCKPAHRTAYAREFGLRGKVSKVSICQGGEISIVLRFGIEERERAQRITPSTVLTVVEA